METVEEVLNKLKARADPAQLAGMSRYGITVEQRLGVNIPEIRAIAKQTGKDHQLALSLWQTGIAEAMILASMVAVPEQITAAQMEAWVVDFNSWDVCDQVCMNLFEKNPFAWDKVQEWSQREEEFVKRAAYALIACIAWHEKTTPDEKFTTLFPLIIAGSTDQRNYVKKAVSWALRNIGKRNVNLNAQALDLARNLKESESKTARWIGSDAIRDLTSEPTCKRLARNS